LKKLNDNSIDIVFTDPPYFDQVAYSEYLKIWEYFFNFKTNLTNEIIVTNRGYIKSDRKKYLKNIEIVFSEIFKKLKHNGEMLIYFKDSKEKNYMDFISLMLKIGFSFNRQKHLNPNKVTYKQNASAKTTSRGDCVIYFDKNPKRKVNKYEYTNDEFLVFLKKEVKNYLRINSKASTGELLDNIIFYEIINKNYMYKIDEKRIIKFLDENFIFDNNMWYLN
jgi:adenine-specific DNA methylase